MVLRSEVWVLILTPQFTYISIKIFHILSSYTHEEKYLNINEMIKLTISYQLKLFGQLVIQQ